MSLKRVVFDVEANGLLNTVTQIHCIVLFDYEKEIYYKYHNHTDIQRDGSIEDGINKLVQYDRLIGHNITGYDLPLIQRFFPDIKNRLNLKDYEYFTDSGKIVDTYMISTIVYPERRFHSVDSYGKDFNIEKPEHSDWANFSKQMLHRCTEDVKIQVKIYEGLLDEMG